jgi:hypothetical protein
MIVVACGKSVAVGAQGDSSHRNFGGYEQTEILGAVGGPQPNASRAIRYRRSIAACREYGGSDALPIRKHASRRQVVHVPNANNLIRLDGERDPSVGGESEMVNLAVMWNLHGGAPLGRPEIDSAVSIHAKDLCAVRAYRHGSAGPCNLERRAAGGQ